MTHKHHWTRDTTRTHGDYKRGRFFVICSCGETAQAVINHGLMHIFKTNRYRGGSKVISTRVSDEEHERYLKDRERFKKEVKKLLQTN